MFLRIIIASFLSVAVSLTSHASEANSSEKRSRAEITELFVQEMKQNGVLEQIGTPLHPTWHALTPSFGALIHNYMACYPSLTYGDYENRAKEFGTVIRVPEKLGLIDGRYLTTGGYAQHFADAKGFFFFDLQEKEAVLGILNYKDLVPIVGIHVSPTASPETVGKGVEFIRRRIQAYMDPADPANKHSIFHEFPPFTLHTVSCSD